MPPRGSGRTAPCVLLLLRTLLLSGFLPDVRAEGRTSDGAGSDELLNLVDLHTHSRLSDGSDSPLEVVQRAFAKGVHTLAFTEHDQLTYDADALAWAEQHGMRVVRGTELSCEWTFAFPAAHETALRTHSKAHLLGYFTRADASSTLARLLADLQAKRQARNNLILRELLRKFRIDISEQAVMDAAAAKRAQDNAASSSGAPDDGGIEYLGRPHIALALVAAGHASSISDAFSRYLSDEKLPLPSWSLDLSTAIGALHEHGAVSVLAHPVTLGLGMEQLERELAALLSSRDGRHLRGLEVYSSKHTAEESAALLAIADRLGLVPTGGSDYHGTNKENVPLGAFGKTKDAAQSTARWKLMGAGSLARLERIRDGIQQQAVRKAGMLETPAPHVQAASEQRPIDFVVSATQGASWLSYSQLAVCAVFVSLLLLLFGSKLVPLSLRRHWLRLFRSLR